MAGIINMFPGGSEGGGGGFVPGASVIVEHSAGAGGMTDHGVVTLADGDYRLLEVKQSGTLTFDDDQIEQGIFAELCLVSGGQGGGGGGYAGGAGGRLHNVKVLISTVNAVAVIGAGGLPASAVPATGNLGGQTSLYLDDEAYTVASLPAGNGTGGGQGGYAESPGTGDGKSKYPFEDSGYFSPHCGGGGGGGIRNSSAPHYAGGNGGTNGGNGGTRTSVGSAGAAVGGAAGDSSAGAGGNYNTAGSPAAYYGGAGGAGGRNLFSGEANYAGGNGYQGVIWIRIPA